MSKVYVQPLSNIAFNMIYAYFIILYEFLQFVCLYVYPTSTTTSTTTSTLRLPYVYPTSTLRLPYVYGLPYVYTTGPYVYLMSTLCLFYTILSIQIQSSVCVLRQELKYDESGSCWQS